VVTVKVATVKPGKVVVLTMILLRFSVCPRTSGQLAIRHGLLIFPASVRAVAAWFRLLVRRVGVLVGLKGTQERVETLKIAFPDLSVTLQPVIGFGQ
jgi:hypothetical protein